MGGTVLEAVTVLDVLLLLLSLPLSLALHQAAMSIDDRLARTAGTARAGWLAAGVALLSAGLWVLVLATVLPFRNAHLVEFAALPALLSAGLALSSVACAFAALQLEAPRWVRIPVGALLWGGAVGAMHYLHLRALGWTSAVREDPLFTTQVAVVVVAGAGILLWIAVAERELRPWRRWWRVLGNVVAVLAPVAAVYSGFIATGRARRAPVLPTDRTHFLVDQAGLLVAAVVLLAALGAVMVGATVDRNLRRRRAETEALRRSEDRFRSLIQASAQIVWTTDPSGEMVGEQPSWSQFTGQEEPAYRGWGWFNAVHPDDREATASVWQASLANRRSVEVEHRVRRFDGQYRDCVARVVPVLEPDGRVREWVGTHTDITERARMQEERDLLASAGRVLSSSLDERETLNAIATLLVPRVADWCAVDIRAADDSIERIVATHSDPRRTTLLGEIHTPPEIGSDQGPSRVLATGESEMFREVDETVLRTIASDDDDFERLREVGVTSLLTVPLTARRQVLGVLTLALAEGEPYDLRDLALAEELARRSAIAIDNARLYSASRAAIQARDEMMSIVSHDLRNPLSTISMTSDLLLQVPTGIEEQRRHLQTIGRAAASMNRLIRDLLDAGQVDSGSLVVDRRPLDPGALAEETCEAMAPMAAEKHLRITCEVQHRLPMVEADAERLRQVLSNLLGNAVKFVPEGGSIHLRVAHRPGEVLFSVFDDGPGIPPEHLPRVFDRHWRGKDTAHLGAGLGLAISRAIVEAHGGNIWAESEPGRGSAFHFTVPEAGSDGSASPQPEEADGSPAPEQQYDLVSGQP